MANFTTGEQIAQRVAHLNLLDERQLQEVWGELGRQDVSAEEFLQLLVRRELLTNFQVERLQSGDRTGFFYGDYKVLYRVAVGSFARVYRAVHKDSGKIVALKVLRKRFRDDSDQTDQFYREGQMGQTLRHPNIVPIYEVHRGRDHYLVMEFVEGGNLRDFVRIRKKLSPTEATQIVADLASGLSYALQRGISHRDLKLTNALVSSRGQAKLVDFGLAGADERVSDDGLESATASRTIDYAGLERATHVRRDDPRSDIYFLGCIYYHLLTGKPALQETRERVQRLSKQRFLDVVPIHQVDPSLPRVVAMVCNRSLELNADRRYQTPAEMLVDLKLAAEKLADGTDLPAEDEAGDQIDARQRERLAAMMIPQSERRVLMFVESNTRMQDIFRDGLKRCGYRVLLTSDPKRALSRFKDDAKAADCVVFSTGNLGEAALDAFNSFGDGDDTSHVPAVLLLGERQQDWKSRANLGEGRIAVAMPIKLRQFRTLLAELVPPASKSAEGS